MDILIIIALFISIGINAYLFVELEEMKLAEEKRKQMVYRTSLKMERKLEELNSIPKDYEDGEEPYDGIAGDR